MLTITKNFEYRGREFGLTVIVNEENNTVLRVIINDDGLEFPFATKPFEKAAEFLSEEFGGEVEEALQALKSVYDFSELQTTETVEKIELQEKKEKKARKPREKQEKTPKNVKNKEKLLMTFELAKGPVTRTVQVKSIEEGATPIDVEEVQLDEIHVLRIEKYSAKNRTSTLINKETGEKLIANVSLINAIYKYAEITGMDFRQADKYIKQKRGLKVPGKKPKEETQNTVIE